jgi:hypothetical protein
MAIDDIDRGDWWKSRREVVVQIGTRIGVVVLLLQFAQTNAALSETRRA